MAEKIDGLKERLPDLNIREGLHFCRHRGNKAAHELEPMTQDEARKAIEFFGEVLSLLYDLPEKAAGLWRSSGVVTNKNPGSVH